MVFAVAPVPEACSSPGELREGSNTLLSSLVPWDQGAE